MRTLILFGTLLLTACAEDAPPSMTSPDDPGVTEYQLEAPTLKAIAPTQLSLGDKVQVLGQKFIDPKHGDLRVHLVGAFTDDQGGSSRYEGDVPVTYRNDGLAEFTFGPRVIFA